MNKKTYKEIYKGIKDKFKIEHKTGYSGDDFIQGVITLRTKVRLGNIAYANFTKLAEDYLTATPSFKQLTNMLELQCSKPIWRIDQKRVAHGLESWFI